MISKALTANNATTRAALDPTVSITKRGPAADKLAKAIAKELGIDYFDARQMVRDAVKR